MNNGRMKNIILLASAIAASSLAVLFTALSLRAAKALSYTAMGIYTGIAVLCLWGAPILYYFSARVRLSLRESLPCIGTNVDGAENNADAAEATDAVPPADGEQDEEGTQGVCDTDASDREEISEEAENG